MNVLVIDTATAVELVAVTANGRPADETAPVEVSHSVTLFDSIDRCLDKAGITLSQVGLIGVGTGPGSFTGIRIAVTTARMLAQILDVPLVGIGTHLLYAAPVPCSPGDQVLVAFDAKKKRVFGSLYRCGTGLPEELVKPGDYDISLILDRAEKGTTHCVGDGTERYRDIIEKRLKQPLFHENFLPSGKTACLIALDMYEASPQKEFPHTGVVPRYARKSDAEIEKKAKRK